MKFLKKIKPSKVLRKRTDDGYTKPALEGALVRLEPVPTPSAGSGSRKKVIKDHLVLYASNEYSFVRIDLGVKEALDEPGPVPVAALKHMEAGARADLGMDQIRVGIAHYDRVLAETKPGVSPPGEDDFPQWERMLEQNKIGADPSGVNVLTFDVNPKLLMKVAEAIGEPDRVQITFDLRKAKTYPGQKRRWYSGPLRVQGPFKRSRDADAYLMPMKPEGHGDEDPTGGALPK